MSTKKGRHKRIPAKPAPRAVFIRLMGERGFDERSLAAATGCTPQYIREIAKGNTSPRLPLAHEICAVFDGDLKLSDLGIEIDPRYLANDRAAS